MAKIIKYKFLSATTEAEGIVEEILIDKEFRCTADNLAANEEIAKREAYNGEYTIEDDGQPDPADTPTELEALDARLTYVEMMTGLLEV